MPGESCRNDPLEGKQHRLPLGHLVQGRVQKMPLGRSHIRVAPAESLGNRRTDAIPSASNLTRNLATVKPPSDASGGMDVDPAMGFSEREVSKINDGSTLGVGSHAGSLTGYSLDSLTR